MAKMTLWGSIDRSRRPRRGRDELLMLVKRSSLAVFLTVLMFSSLASAGISAWSGPAVLAGTSKTVTDAFEVPGNATVIDAWLHVDESGFLEDGSGITWTGEDVPGNFTSGQFTNTLVGKFEGAMSLMPDSAVSNVDTFSSASLQLPSSWTHTGQIWEAINPSTLGGTVSGQTRTLAHGYVPAAASDGGVVAATLPGQGLPAGSTGALVSPQFNVPNPINLFNLSFSHWHHLDVDDGAWVEYKLDNGPWTYIEPIGGYPSNVSVNAPVPNGINHTGFGAFGDGNFSSWSTAVFTLDNITGLQNANLMQFRFVVYTDLNSTARPGWYIDEYLVTNVGNSTGFWHHGCYTLTATTCYYSNNAEAALEGSIDLSSTNAGSKIQTRLEFDLEGSSYDNFCVELSTNNGTSWTDISSSSGSSTSSCSSRGSIPGSGYTLPSGTTVYDESGGFVILDFSIPSSMIGATSASKIRYIVDTDSSVQYGGSIDDREGLTVDWYKVIDSSGSTVDSNLLSNSTTASHYSVNGGANDWSFVQIGAGGLNLFDSWENSPALPPGGWSLSNQAGQVGWEFGAVCTNYTDGPTSFPSASLGFATNLCGDYDSSSDNSLISPNYFVPVGASARFVWKHWMCSEDTWDGGALYYSVNGGNWIQAYVNTGNGTNWYDGTITNTFAFSGTDVWDGRQYVNAAGAFSCSSTVNIPWLDMEYDVSNLSGNNVSFRFRQMADSAVQEPGWYVDNIGLEVDWFETEGSWMSPLVQIHELGYGFVDADVILPANTWYGVNILDSSGQVIEGHENLSFPVSLASIDRESHPSIHVEVLMGTEDEYYTPLVRELTVGATRYFSGSNGWSIPSSVSQLSNGTWVNNGGSTQVITGESGLSSRPLSSALVLGDFTQTTVSLTTDGNQMVSTNMANTILDLGGMRTYITPRITMAPGSMIDSLAIQGQFAQPAHDASIDLADDGTIDWQFSSAPNYGSYGWQTYTNTNPVKRSLSVSGNDTLSFLIPEVANIHSLLLGLNPDGETDPLTLSNNGNSFYQLYLQNWSRSVISIANPQIVSSGTQVDNFGRNWSVFNIELNSSPATNYEIGSFAVGYTILENVSGLGMVVKSYHEGNSNNGLESIVDVPIKWNAAAGGVSIDGGVYHENMITNHPFSVPETWYPNGLLQGFSTQHHHLLGNENIDEIHLTGLDSSGDTLTIVLNDIENGGNFNQISGFGMLKLDNSSNVSEIGGRLVVNWQFDVDWDWNDSQSMQWSAQGFDEDGEGLSPATAQSGGVATQASENDLQVDSWSVTDLYGHTLSDMFSPSYPFWAKSGSQVSVSGTVRFDNTLDMRPQKDDFVVAVDVNGIDVVLNSTADGQWTGLVNLPTNVSQANLTPYVLRVGPAQGASGAIDTTLTTPVVVKLDDQSPFASNLQVNNGQRLLDADGFTWDPSSTLSLQVTITDEQALGNEVIMHFWREGMDDDNLDGVADETEYQQTAKPLPEGVAGERTITFSGIDVSGLETNALLSVYFTGMDYAGHELMHGGHSGVENDMATLVIAINEPTSISTSSLNLDTVNEQLLAGQSHKLSMEISDANGINSIDLVSVKLLGTDEEFVGVMNWEPRNGMMYTSNDSMVNLHNISTEQISSDTWLVEWEFKLDWDFDESILGDYSLPTIVVYDDDDLNPVALLTNLGEIRWQLDNNLQVQITNMSDNTPPISNSSPDHIYVKPGDDLQFSGIISYEKSGAILTNLPPQGLEVIVTTTYGSENIQAYAEVNGNGEWSTGLVLPSRALVSPILTVNYGVTGVISPGNDATNTTSLITVDETSPIVQFATVPLSLDDSELEVLQFSILVIEEGGLPSGDLTVNWAFLRNNLVMENGESSGKIPFVSSNDGTYTFAGSVDFTEGVNVSLEDGDELIWWIDVVDLAGNTASGTGLSRIDSMNTDFTVLSFDATVTNIEISLADGSVPKGNQVVEGTEISVVVHARNLGTKPGTLTISLVEDMGQSRTWLTHESVELSLAPGQTLNTIPMLFETHGSGPQNLYVNISGMDLWIENSMLPHCAGINGNATCDLNVESDMPRVITQEDAESGIGGMTAIISILALLLGGAGLTIVVLLRRGNDNDSIFYEDEWEDEDDGDYDETPTPILPPMAPERPNMDAANSILDNSSKSEEE